MDVARRHRRRTGLAALTALAGALVLLGAAAPAVARPVPVDGPLVGWTPVWSDQFGGAAGTGVSADWIVDTGHGYPGGAPRWGTGELESATAAPANLGLDGRGHLALTARRDATGAWTSARIETRRADVVPPAGGSLRIQARIALPAGGAGYWPAFWALGAPFRPSDTNWPGAGEIDVLEQINGQPTVHGTLHCGRVESGGPCHEDTGLTGAYRVADPTAFHTYTLIWSTRPQRLEWLVDGYLYWTVPATTVGAATWADSLGHGFFLILDVAIGGNWPGRPTASTASGAAMLVDYVTVSVRGAP